MNENNAGSAAGIDLAEMREEFEAAMPTAYARDRNMPDGSYNSLYLHVAWEVWQIARATPQHPEQKPVAYLHQVVAGDGEPDEALSFAPDNFPLAGTLGYRSVGYRPLYDHPATPQHSVTEQDEQGTFAIFPPELPKYMPDFPFPSQEALWDHAVLTGYRATLASTAATQPEQADELESRWVALLDAANAYLSLDVDPGIMIQLGDKQTWLGLGTKAQLGLMCDGRSGAEIERDRAALAIPASTAANCGNSHQSPYEKESQPSLGLGDAVVSAASEQQAGANEPCAECDGKGFHRDDDENPTWEHYCEQCLGSGRVTLTHRATTATELFCGMDYVRTPTAAPAVATTAADQQGDTVPVSVERYHDGVFEVIKTRYKLCTCQGAAQAQAGERYACIGKGGEYELIGKAIPAGVLSSTLMVSSYPVYRDTVSGKLFVRTAADFDQRMERAAMAAPATSGGGNG